MHNNPEQAIQFCREHIDNAQYREAYTRLGYMRSDLEDINLSAIAKESQSFMRGLDEGDQQYYLKRKYEAMVLRRHKIVKEVNEEYDGRTKSVRNMSALTDRTDSKHPIIDKLHQEQSIFFDKESKYYEKVTNLKLKKFLQSQVVQQNSYLNSEHYKTLRDKTSSLSFSDRKSIKTCLSQSHSVTLSQQKRKCVYNRAQMRKQFQMELQTKNFMNKSQIAREKVARVYKNLKILTMEKKYKSEVDNKIVQKNKEVVRKHIVEDIYKKKVKINRQMQIFSQNRREQIYLRDQKILSQKNIHIQREKSVQQYLQRVVKRNRQLVGRHLQRQLEQAQKNKKMIDQLRRIQLKQAAQIHQQREFETNQAKEMLQAEKDRRNKQMYMAYTKNLHQAIQTRDQKVKSVRTKLLDDRIKDQLASKNQKIINRQQEIKKQQIQQKIDNKNKTINEIESLKSRLIDDRRVFIGKTLKKIRILDRELNDKLGTISPRSISRSRHFNNSFTKPEGMTSSKILIQ